MKIFRELTEQERQQLLDAVKWSHDNSSGCAPIVACMFLAILFICSCKSIEYVPIETSHNEYHNHIDSVIKKDSLIREKNTIIRELDSATAAMYDIRLKNAERAFLIQTKEFEKQIQMLLELKRDTVNKADSILVPVPVERELTKWEQAKMDYGAVAIGVTAVAFLYLLFRIIIWIKKKGK